MTCSLPDGVRIHFLESGIIVRPADLSTRSPRRNYSHAKIKVNEEVADLISRDALHREPVNVEIGGSLQDRYFYSKDTLEMHQDGGSFKLWDPRKILNSGVLTQSWPEVIVGTVLKYIFNNRNDKYGVLSGYRVIDQATVEEETQDTTEDIAEWFQGENHDANREGWGGVGNAINAYTVDYGAAALGLIGIGNGKKEAGEVDFDDISPLEALNDMEDRFSFTTWVDREGVLNVGQPEQVPFQFIHATGHSYGTDNVLSQFNVTRGSSRVTMVHLKGMFDLKEFMTKGADETFSYPIAVAKAVDENGDWIEGDILQPFEPADVKDMGNLKDAAENRLLNHTQEYRNGNVVFNGLASNDKSKLAGVQNGDWVIFPDGIGKNCGKDVDGGLFSVKEVQHKVSARRGWNITLEVTQVPFSIESEAVIYDTTGEEIIEDLETYRGIK